MNLITSCFDCNHGKSDRQLDDNTIIQKQYSELEKLNERREQLEMLIEWRNSLEGLQNTELEYFEKVISDKFDRSLTEIGRKRAVTLIKKYSLGELLTIIDLLSRQTHEASEREDGLKMLFKPPAQYAAFESEAVFLPQL
ncbi:hypothetical protein AGMMS50268_41460 [Spirochaetia bacterium]|nr:hypothetical protein AGMMS50268_41460 [Spirochaetia bacterium]